MKTCKFSEIQGKGEVQRIALARELGAPLETVWRVLTEVEHVQHWWPDWEPGGIIEKHEGGIVRLADGSWIDGLVKVWRPPHIFEFTWQENIGGNPEWYERHTKNLLRIDLVEIAQSSTLLHLIQFAPKDSAVGGAAGWHHFAGERLSSYLENGEVIDEPGRFNQLKTFYETC